MAIGTVIVGIWGRGWGGVGCPYSELTLAFYVCLNIPHSEKRAYECDG